MDIIVPPEQPTQVQNRCPETRGYCQCDKPDDGHRYHHCPECATHPNGGYAFAVWVVRKEKAGRWRTDESMHEYAGPRERSVGR